MAQEIFDFDDRLLQDGEYVLATRQIVFGVDFGDDDGKPGVVYEFHANEETRDAFKEVMKRFIAMSRRVEKVALPRVPNNTATLDILKRQRRQVDEDRTPRALTAAKPTVVIAQADIPAGFWQGKERTELRAAIREWAIAEGKAQPGDFSRGRIPDDLGIAFGVAFPDRIPKEAVT